MEHTELQQTKLQLMAASAEELLPAVTKGEAKAGAVATMTDKA